MANAVVYLIYNAFLNPLLTLISGVLASIQSESLVMAQATWVSDAAQVSAAFAASLLTLNFAYRAITAYVLWNEGTPSDSGILIKSAFRATLYGAGGGFMAYYAFKYGIWLGAAYVASPVVQAFTGVQAMVATVAAESGVDELLLMLLFVIVVLALIFVVIQMAIRGFELCIYMIAAPFAALGWMNPDGGIWQSWWRGAVVLALSFPVQMLCLYGTVEVVAAQAGNPFLAGLEMLAGVIVTIRGPSLLAQWAYHSGIGGIIGTQGNTFVSNYVRGGGGAAKTGGGGGGS